MTWIVKVAALVSLVVACVMWRKYDKEHFELHRAMRIWCEKLQERILALEKERQP